MQVTLCGGKVFQVEDGEIILGAALSAGVILEHSCKTGRCGACKARVEAGITRALLDETGLSPAEREVGWILTCARTVVSDIQLDIEDLNDFKLYPSKTLPCRIHSLKRLSSDVLQVILRLPPNQQLNYHPGQYVDVIGKGGLRRSYSIATAATDEKLIELHIRQVADGEMSRYWFCDAQVGDLLRLNGPLGTFFLREIAGLDLIFLATGTGMAPIKAMLEGMVAGPKEHQPRSVRVYWGGRVPQDLYWSVSEIDLEVEYTPVLSRADSSWLGARGYVQQAVSDSDVNLEHAVVYACGSLAMVDSARTRLVTAGLNPRRFYSDAFVSSSQRFQESS